MPLSLHKAKRVRLIFLVYWFLLTYIIAALVWWFIALNRQNRQMAQFEISKLKAGAPQYDAQLNKITNYKKRKTAQYLGEGAIFLLLILAGAFFIYRAVRRQFKSAQQQQNFIMAITHELKTPIAITKLNLETLQKRKLEETQQLRLIHNTIQEANRLNALCNNMLLASQMESGGNPVTKEPIDLSVLVKECVHDFIMRFPQRSFQTVLPGEANVTGDVLLLKMAVNNLLDNAIKYSPKDSTIAITVQKVDKNIRLIISDEGKGIEDGEKIKYSISFTVLEIRPPKKPRVRALVYFLQKNCPAA